MKQSQRKDQDPSNKVTPAHEASFALVALDFEEWQKAAVLIFKASAMKQHLIINKRRRSGWGWMPK